MKIQLKSPVLRPSGRHADSLSRPLSRRQLRTAHARTTGVSTQPFCDFGLQNVTYKNILIPSEEKKVRIRIVSEGDGESRHDSTRALHRKPRQARQRILEANAAAYAASPMAPPSKSLARLLARMGCPDSNHWVKAARPRFRSVRVGSRAWQGILFLPDQWNIVSGKTGSGVPETPQSRLFISYSRKDKGQVYAFAEALTAAGINVWVDREEIDPLDDFPACIREGIAQCHAFLAWYTPEYAQSAYCQKELTAAWICAQRLTRNVLSRRRRKCIKIAVRPIFNGRRHVGGGGRPRALARACKKTPLGTCAAGSDCSAPADTELRYWRPRSCKKSRTSQPVHTLGTPACCR